MEHRLNPDSYIGYKVRKKPDIAIVNIIHCMKALSVVNILSSVVKEKSKEPRL